VNDRPARAETATEGVFRQFYRREDGLTHLSRPGLHERTANRTTPSIDGSINCSIFILLGSAESYRVPSGSAKFILDLDWRSPGRAGTAFEAGRSLNCRDPPDTRFYLGAFPVMTVSVDSSVCGSSTIFVALTFMPCLSS